MSGQVAAMLGFLFSMEGLALSLGRDRAQLELAVAQSHPEEPAAYRAGPVTGDPGGPVPA